MTTATIMMVAVLSCVLLANLSLVYADSNSGTSDFGIVSIKSNATVSYSGNSSYKESIVVNTHGDDKLFIISLPEKFDGLVSNVDVEGYNYEYDPSNNSISVNLVDEKTTEDQSDEDLSSLIIRKAISLSYDVARVDNLGQKNDVLDVYFLTGDENSFMVMDSNNKSESFESIDSVSCNMYYSDDLKWDKRTRHVGSGTKNSSKYGKWSMGSDRDEISFNGSEIPVSTPIYVEAVFPSGYFANSTEIGWTRTLAISVFVLGIIIFVLMRIIFGREKEIKVVKTTLPPYNMNPVELGYMADGYVDDRDIVGLGFYLGQKGFVKIREYEISKYTFEYLKYPEKEDKATRILFNSIFGENGKQGDVVKLDDVAADIKHAVPQIRRKTARLFRGGRAAFTTGSRLGNTIIRLVYAVVVAMLPLMNFVYHIRVNNIMGRGAIVSLGVALLLTFLLSRVSIEFMKLHRKQVDGNKLHFYAWTAIYAITSLIYVYMFRFSIDGRMGDNAVTMAALAFLIISPLMLFGFRSRNAKATEVIGQLEGFKQFLVETDGQELSDVAGIDGKYFFRIMPYAYILGITKKVTSNFEDIPVPAPEWYIPYGVSQDYNFDIVIFNSMTRNFEKQMFEIIRG